MRAETAVAALETPDVAGVTEPSAVQYNGTAADQRPHTAEDAASDEAIESLLRELKAHEDAQEVLRRSEEEIRLEHIRGLEEQLESSDLQELFTLELRETQQQKQREGQRQRLATQRLQQQQHQLLGGRRGSTDVEEERGEQ